MSIKKRYFTIGVEDEDGIPDLGYATACHSPPVSDRKTIEEEIKEIADDFDDGDLLTIYELVPVKKYKVRHAKTCLEEIT